MRMKRRLALWAALLALAGGKADARVYLTVQQALDAVFPQPMKVERRTLYLNEAQARRAAEAAGVPVEGRVIPYYVGSRDRRGTGFAYFDTHLVRTLPETILVFLAPDGELARLEIVSFDEPEDYLPSSRWLQQFPGRGLEDLGPRQGIRALTGATLSARAVTQAARRILALHRLFVAAPAGAPGGAQGPPP